jgi:hypothetical protein
VSGYGEKKKKLEIMPERRPCLEYMVREIQSKHTREETRRGWASERPRHTLPALPTKARKLRLAAGVVVVVGGGMLLLLIC